MPAAKGKNGKEYLVGKTAENRRSLRRQTLASVEPVDGLDPGDKAIVTNLSGEGAFIRTRERYEIGSRIQFRLQLPTGSKKAISIGGKVVRIESDGVGIRFEELRSRDLSKIRQYTGFSEMDDAVVSVQRTLSDVVSGNLLPVSDQSLIEQRLRLASEKRLRALVVDLYRNVEPTWANLRLDRTGIRLENMERRLPDQLQAVYIIVFDGPLHFMFEGLLVDKGSNPRVLDPERMYHNERRSSQRTFVQDTWLEMMENIMDGERLRLPVVDLSEQGCAIRAPRSSMIVPGMRLPCFELKKGQWRQAHEGATVRRLTPDGPEQFLVGLNFTDDFRERDSFAEIRDRSTKPSFWTTVTRMSGVAKEKFRELVVGKGHVDRDMVCVTHYKNDREDGVTSLLNASFDLNEEPPEVDVAVVVAPAFLKRKEVFSLLARTLIDNFKKQGINGVVLRFDATHTVGESEVDPELEEKGCPYLRWTFSHLESDIVASFRYLQRRFNPKARVVVTYSVAAMAARRMLADGRKPGADLWIAPFGCPDAQDMFQNYLAGIDLFKQYKKGETAEPFLIYGRLADPNFVFTDAMKRGMAFLEDARKDMEKITSPVTWIVGTYDYMVTRERVRNMLNAPGGGIREVYEMSSGHILKTGNEAIESFKLISESISRHIFGVDARACEPDLAVHARQMNAEWARVKRDKLTDTTGFWDRHLFGSSEETLGYDVLLYNPEYVTFLEEQVGMLDLQAGQHVADIGCGTGNLSIQMVNQIPVGTHKQTRLTCVDLVPGAIACTNKKIAEHLRDRDRNGDPPIDLNCHVVDLETARLAPIRDFLEGRLYNILALSGRIEGLHDGTLRRILESYNQDIHDILRGRLVDMKTIFQLCPSLDQEEAETVLELSRAARFILGSEVAEDLREGVTKAVDARDLIFKRVNFGPANRVCRIDLPSDAFDRIGCSLVLSYLFDPISVVRELHRALVPGGILVLSSLKPNFDSSKSYLEEAKTIAESDDLAPEERTRLLNSLREFGSFVGCVLELEDEGRFQFFSQDQLSGMIKAVGFQEVQRKDSFGHPETAAIIKARKCR